MLPARLSAQVAEVQACLTRSAGVQRRPTLYLRPAWTKMINAAGVRLSIAVCFIMRAGFKEPTCDAGASALQTEVSSG